MASATATVTVTVTVRPDLATSLLLAAQKRYDALKVENAQLQELCNLANDEVKRQVHNNHILKQDYEASLNRAAGYARKCDELMLQAREQRKADDLYVEARNAEEAKLRKEIADLKAQLAPTKEEKAFHQALVEVCNVKPQLPQVFPMTEGIHKQWGALRQVSRWEELDDGERFIQVDSGPSDFILGWTRIKKSGGGMHDLARRFDTKAEALCFLVYGKTITEMIEEGFKNQQPRLKPRIHTGPERTAMNHTNLHGSLWNLYLNGRDPVSGGVRVTKEQAIDWCLYGVLP